MTRFLLCLSLLMFSTGAWAQALWRGVPVGATPLEVQALIPEARTSQLTGPTSEPAALLEIPAFELAGAPFKVSFIFAAERLQRITLLADAGSAAQANALGERLTTSLRSRYGLEMSTRSRGSTSSLTIDRQWSFRRTSVHLQVIDTHFVSLEYSGQAPVRNNRL